MDNFTMDICLFNRYDLDCKSINDCPHDRMKSKVVASANRDGE